MPDGMHPWLAAQADHIIVRCARLDDISGHAFWPCKARRIFTRGELRLFSEAVQQHERQPAMHAHQTLGKRILPATNTAISVASGCCSR